MRYFKSKPSKVRSCSAFWLTVPLLLMPLIAHSNDLFVEKSCPVNFQNDTIGTLVISKPWFHESRISAAYQAMDNATGIGVEIHFFANKYGDVRYENYPNCDSYRIFQVRKTNARLNPGEKQLQADVPDYDASPYYDSGELEHGRGTHQTPIDTADKPWDTRPTRSSTVSIYDTPYVSDAYGIEGKPISVRFETCAVCSRDHTIDTILACVSWGYDRDYMGGHTGWSEPELQPISCHSTPSRDIYSVINSNETLSSYFGY